MVVRFHRSRRAPTLSSCSYINHRRQCLGFCSCPFLFFIILITFRFFVSFFAAFSIHTSRLFSGYRDTLMSSSGQSRISVLRLLGPTNQSAIAVGAFWLLALALNVVLFTRAGCTLFNYNGTIR